MHIGPTEFIVGLVIVVLLIWGGVRRQDRWCFKTIAILSHW